MSSTWATRRGFLATLAAAFPTLAVTPVQAWTGVSGQDLGLVPATGVWAILDHVTDGTNPSTTVIASPTFTPDIKKLAGTEITLNGFVQPVSGGFGGEKEYLLSRNSFHCPFCYTSGRGSLVLATISSHVLTSDRRLTVSGTLVLQNKDPADFYFQLKNARVVA